MNDNPTARAGGRAGDGGGHGHRHRHHHRHQQQPQPQTAMVSPIMDPFGAFGGGGLFGGGLLVRRLLSIIDVDPKVRIPILPS